GVYQAVLTRAANDTLSERDRTRIAPYVIGPFDITEQLSETKLQARRGQIRCAFKTNEDGPRSNLTYLEEAYYFVPVHLALQLQPRGQYVAALDWFRMAYDYSVWGELRKIYFWLSQEEPTGDPEEDPYKRLDQWLLDPLNPHAIAETRFLTYTRFTILALARCLMEFADSEFTRDTAESVPRARMLYMTALELLELPELNQKLGQCDALIGNLKINVGSD